jgi:17beta-estradiol 17-dehydrogenase / very-long-chain 3-oxoacyl-CoA reductase
MNLWAGFSLVDQLLTIGFDVIIHGRSPEKLARVVDEMQKKHPNRSLASVVADLSKMEDVENLVAAMGSHRVTVLINNAAATGLAFHLFVDMPREQIDRTLTTNILFLTRLLEYAIPLLCQNGPSLLINIGSQSAENPTPYVSIYGASKAYMMVSPSAYLLDLCLMSASSI